MNKLIHGDCLSVMRQIPGESIAAVVTDPFFAYVGGSSTGMANLVDPQFFSHWWRAVCEQLKRILAPTAEGFIWCDWRTATHVAQGFAPHKQTYENWRISQMLYHYREMPGQGKPFRSSVDMIAYLRGPKSKGKRIPLTTQNWISKYWYYGKHEWHPAEKDVELCRQLILWCSDEGDIILDPFTGSATAAIAANMENRKFVAIEKNDIYFNTACRRLDKHNTPFSKETAETSHNSTMLFANAHADNRTST